MSKKTAIILTQALLLLLANPFPAAAQSSDITLSAEYTFGEEIEFQARLPLGMSVNEATVFYIAEGELLTRSQPAEWDKMRTLRANADVSQSPVRAFSSISYWFEITFKNGQMKESDRSTLYYEDNRYEWQVRESQHFKVHWYAGDITFAQALLDTAELGAENIQSIMPLKLSNSIDIYAYDSAQEMRATLQLLGTSWVGAHTDPDLGVMVVSLPAGPEQRLEMERQIPHETMHLMLYHWLGAGYTNLPTWLEEGLASISELYPNPDYLALLDNAFDKDDLLPIVSLCDTFPRDASGAFLAYAQATSFTRFLQRQYGSNGLEKLTRAYADGLSCERGVQVALGSTLNQLELRWRREAFGNPGALRAIVNLSPWLGLLVLALIVPLWLTICGARKQPSANPSNESL